MAKQDRPGASNAETPTARTRGRSLILKRETLRLLCEPALREVAGGTGATAYSISPGRCKPRTKEATELP